jgi:hypothetical protein
MPCIERFFLSRKIALELGLTFGNDAPTTRIFVKKDSRYLYTVTIAKNDFVHGHEHVPFLLARILTESLHSWRITASSESREENQQFTVLQCSPVRFNPLANVTCLLRLKIRWHSLTGLNGGKMHPTFAIFVMLPDGQPFWIESVEKLEDARERLREVARNAPGDCFIYSAKSGVVELIIHSVLRERLSPHASHMVQKGQAS